MYRFITHLLLFFILFTHSAIAMDVHISPISSDESELLIDITQTTFVADKGDCEDLAGHCSHSAAHVSGMLSALSLPFLDKPIALFSIVKISPFIRTQAPPLRPPKI